MWSDCEDDDFLDRRVGELESKVEELENTIKGIKLDFVPLLISNKNKKDELVYNIMNINREEIMDRIKSYENYIPRLEKIKNKKKLNYKDKDLLSYLSQKKKKINELIEKHNSKIDFADPESLVSTLRMEPYYD